MVLCPRYHLFEINDEAWFPPSLRSRVQADLTLLWTFKVPFIQTTSPATLVASTLIRVLGSRTPDYTYVDFCSGAGGPTPVIEQEVNRQLQKVPGSTLVRFLMTDLHPHVDAWQSHVKKSPNLGYVATPVDATNAPKDLLKGQTRAHDHRNQKHLRLFSLAFHHFDDPLAISILENALETSDGFAILELTSRDIPTMIMISLMWPLLMLITPFYFATDLWHLVFTYLIPIVPFVVCFDGYISSLRTRTPAEVKALLHIAASRVAAKRRSATTSTNTSSTSLSNGGAEDEVGGHLLLRDWTFLHGSEMHTPPIGKMSWIICTKNDE